MNSNRSTELPKEPIEPKESIFTTIRYLFQSRPEQKRIVKVNSPIYQKVKFISNSIRLNIINFLIQIISFLNVSINSSTSKYNVITFFPIFISEQFSKLSNVFFLITALIQVCFVKSMKLLFIDIKHFFF
jgi:hypothetical protein